MIERDEVSKQGVKSHLVSEMGDDPEQNGFILSLSVCYSPVTTNTNQQPTNEAEKNSWLTNLLINPV